MSDWKPYVGNRLIKRFEDFVVIKPADLQRSIPLSCPLCDSLLRSRDDEESFNEFGCCEFCAMSWAHPRREEWKNGWRPQRDIVIESSSKRPPRQIKLVFD